MVQTIVIFCVVLICAAVFRNLIVFDSRPLIPLAWILGGAVVSLSVWFLVPRLRNAGSRFLVAQSVMVIMFFAGLGCLAKAQLMAERLKELQAFTKIEAKPISCRVGEEARGRYRRPEGFYFPIWSYEYPVAPSGSVVRSDSESLADFSVRKHFKSDIEAETACKSWSSATPREIFYDPKSPDLSLMEIPKSHAGNLFLFLGAVFVIVAMGGMIALLSHLKALPSSSKIPRGTAPK